MSKLTSHRFLVKLHLSIDYQNVAFISQPHEIDATLKLYEKDIKKAKDVAIVLETHAFKRDKHSMYTLFLIKGKSHPLAPRIKPSRQLILGGNDGTGKEETKDSR